jgi:predicted transcriptional regulator
VKRLQIMLDEDLDEALARMASERGTSKAALIRQFVRAAIGELPPLEQDALFTMAGADSYEPDQTIDEVVYR